MRKFQFNKIIRSKLIENIIETGGIPHIKELNDEEYIKALYGQLQGEVEEIFMADKSHVAEEIADVYEVLDWIVKYWGLNKDDVQQFQKSKREDKGDFSDRRFVEYVEVHDNNPWIDYYLKNADRYPEIK